MLTLQLPTLADTAALGAAAAAALPSDASLFVLELAGDLGSGKTSFARALLQALGVATPVRSPSYALMEHYDIAGWQVLHLDLYRLADAAELEQLGLRDYDSGHSLWLVEWPDKGRGGLPDCDARLLFAAGAAAHSVCVEARSPAGATWLARLRSE
ncbi:MAG: tRNA (adenosine(37)-N6)-threonylcarbamoyltransferase complex ATPase subunit type 1 TsaE [Pseudomonadota bacterium]